jgi:putative membrane protein
MSDKKIPVCLGVLAVVGVLFVPGAALAQALAKADQKMVNDMAVANMAEVAAGKMAVGKTQNADVKTFAQKMIDDHSKALNDVTTLAQSKGVTLPTDVDPPHKAMAAKLDKLSGDAFDKAYMADAGVSDHTKVHAKLKDFEAKAKDADVKALAAKMLPTVEEHLKMAKDMHGAKSAKAK